MSQEGYRCRDPSYIASPHSSAVDRVRQHGVGGMRRTRLTAAAKKKRRRRVVCGHFKVSNCRVYYAESVVDQAVCTICGVITAETRVRHGAPRTYGGGAA